MELRLLVYSAFICLLVWIPYILAEIRQRGLSRAVSYPSGTVEDLPAWAQRAHRAHMNLVENLTPFAALVLVAHFMGVHDQVTLWGAHLFFWSRLVHIVVMWAGIPWVRTAAFTVGVIGNLMILWQILMA
jgi:uncharacterized MAPEG superfamily protein